MLRESTPTVTQPLPDFSNALLPRWATMGFGRPPSMPSIFGKRSLIFLDILRRSGDQQAEMTSRLVNAVAIYDYEISGQNPMPTTEILRRISKAFPDVTLAQLQGGRPPRVGQVGP